MVMNTMDGAQHVSKELVGVAKVLGAKENQIFRKIVLPYSVPYILQDYKPPSQQAGWQFLLQK